MNTSTLSLLGWTLVRVVFGFSLAYLHGYGKVFEGGVHKLVGGVT